MKIKYEKNRLPFINTHIPPEAEEDVSTRYGTVVEKGVHLTEERLLKIEKQLQDRIALWTIYPDLWADEVLLPVGATFKWASYQRVQLREQARVSLIHITGARGVSKTFTGVFGFFHRAIFYPGSSLAITAPTKTQAAQIARQTYADLISRFPLLENELVGPPTGTRDSFIIKFKNGSTIEVTAALESTRGMIIIIIVLRRH